MSPSPPYLKMYSEIAARESSIRSRICENTEYYSAFSEIQHFASEFDTLLGISSNNFAHILAENAFIDLQRSSASAINGRRQEAYATLRMTLEKFLFYIQLSSSEMNFRLWTLGRRDFSWKDLTDDDNGVFSHNFIDCFAPDLTPLRSQFLALARSVYRECSEIIHGNYAKLKQDYVADDITWIADWLEKTRNILMLCLFSWLCRFGGREGDLEVEKTESLFRELLGNIEIVRIKIGWQ